MKCRRHLKTLHWCLAIHNRLNFTKPDKCINQYGDTSVICCNWTWIYTPMSITQHLRPAKQWLCCLWYLKINIGRGRQPRLNHKKWDLFHQLCFVSSPTKLGFRQYDNEWLKFQAEGVSNDFVYNLQPDLCWHVCHETYLDHPLWLLYFYIYSNDSNTTELTNWCLHWIASCFSLKRAKSCLEPSTQSYIWNVFFVTDILSRVLSLFTGSPIHHLKPDSDFFHLKKATTKELPPLPARHQHRTFPLYIVLFWKLPIFRQWTSFRWPFLQLCKPEFV